ncbi:hypothetical protein QMK17_01945 [Rhodococcus sp. G-MC3]|uniref:hypothetical protein n=1 Tax=Rhodococcus sp. G-MC3 TaxID=3046209 RepID=UPI0024B8FFDB|nr:hypothetical protein [Rhodococcus sp. G-MC3]MDJ0392093.1 hypothetical protein [Rhodococcus sp. G-MC3]
MSTDIPPENIPPEKRPRVVTAAYALWLVAAILLILVALVVLTVPLAQLRTALEGQGSTGPDIDSYLSTIRVVGVVCGVFGLALGLLAGPMRAGHARMRRILVAASVLVAVLLMFVVFGLMLFQELLLVVLVLLAASVLVYRPGARGWFARV